MAAIIESIGGLGSGLMAIVDYLGKRLLEGIQLVAYMLEAAAAPDMFMSWAPSFLGSIISTIVLIAVLYRILGWGD